MTLKIKDRVFKIASATFNASLAQWEDEGWVIDWSFLIKTEGAMFDGTTWMPGVYAESVTGFEIPDPHHLEGTVLTIPEAYDDKRDQRLICLYIFEHEDVYSNRIEFRETNGDVSRIYWTAKCNVFWDDDYGSNLDLVIQTNMRFEGINVLANTLDEATEQLARFYNPAGFRSEKAHIGWNFCLR